jgi:hypothetical protein
MMGKSKRQASDGTHTHYIIHIRHTHCIIHIPHPTNHFHLMPRGQAVAVGGSAKQTDKTIVFLLKKVRPLHVKYYLELEKQAPPPRTCAIAFDDGGTDDCVPFTDLRLLKMDINEPATEELVSIFNNLKSANGTQ